MVNHDRSASPTLDAPQACHLESTLALRDTLERVRARNEYLQAHVGDPWGEEWFSGADLIASDSSLIARCMARLGAAYETEHRDVMASFFFGGYRWSIVSIIVGAFLETRRVLSLCHDRLWLRCHDSGHPKTVALGSTSLTVLPDDPLAGRPAVAVVTTLDALRQALLGEIEDHFAPVVAAVRARAPLGARALWLSVADNIAWCVIHHAKGMSGGGADTEVSALVDVPGVPWRGRTSVLDLEHDGRRESFVARASCCLSYKLPSGEMCAACPLRPPSDRLERLRAHMAEQG